MSGSLGIADTSRASAAAEAFSTAVATRASMFFEVVADARHGQRDGVLDVGLELLDGLQDGFHCASSS
jgi:hypothetical protein